MAVTEPTYLIRQAEQHEPVPSAELKAQAEECEKNALRRVGLTASPMVNVLFDFMYAGRAVWTSMIPTKATTVTSDGFVLYMRNPQFQVDLDPEGAEIVDIHEALHPLKGHFNHQALVADGIDPKDPVATLAFEASLNFEATLIAGGGTTHKPMPTIGGKPTGIDWEQVYKDYRKDLTAQGLTPLSLNDFYRTELTTYRELKKMQSMKQPKTPNWCSHTPGSAGQEGDCPSCGKPRPDDSAKGKSKGKGKGKSKADASDSGSGDGQGQPGDPNADSGQGQGSGDSGDAGDGQSGSGSGSGTCSCPSQGSGMDGMDADGVGSMVNAVISEVLREALNGNEAAKADLVKLMGDYEDSDAVSTMFGNMGLGRLIGQAPPAQKINWVGEHIKNIIDGKLRQALRLIRREKIWWEDQITFRGPEQVRCGIIAFDASASMPHSIVSRFTELIGEEKGLELKFWSFDADVWESADTEGIRGGGGTSFQPVYDLACRQDQEVNFLLYVTDGYAPPLQLNGEIDAEKIIWVISPGGDDWPDRDPLNRMECVRLDDWADLGL